MINGPTIPGHVLTLADGLPPTQEQKNDTFYCFSSLPPSPKTSNSDICEQDTKGNFIKGPLLLLSDGFRTTFEPHFEAGTRGEKTLAKFE